MYCSDCGEQTANGAKFCNGCGAKLNIEPSSQETTTKLPAQTDDAAKSEGTSSEELLATFVGAEAGYYLIKWKDIDRATVQNKAPMSWNWFSFVCGPFWFAYRKMYVNMIFLLVAGILLDPIGRKLGIGKYMTGAQIGLAVGTGYIVSVKQESG